STRAHVICDRRTSETTPAEPAANAKPLVGKLLVTPGQDVSERRSRCGTQHAPQLLQGVAANRPHVEHDQESVHTPAQRDCVSNLQRRRRVDDHYVGTLANTRKDGAEVAGVDELA